MKGLLLFLLLSLVSCAHQSDHSLAQREVASSSESSCLQALRGILEERRKREQGFLIAQAKYQIKEWEELQSDEEIISIIGNDLSAERREMALLSMAILKRDYPNESVSQLAHRFRALKRVCTGS